MPTGVIVLLTCRSLPEESVLVVLSTGQGLKCRKASCRSRFVIGRNCVKYE